MALSRATNLPGLILKTFDAHAIKAHPEVKQFYQGLGYTGESEHQDTATVATTVQLLADLYSSCCGDHYQFGGAGSGKIGSHHAVYARAPPQTSAWIVSRQEKANKKRKIEVTSLYEASEAAQIGAVTAAAKVNCFAQYGYEAACAEDAFMERESVVPPPPLPRGLERTLEPYTDSQPPLKFSGRDDSGDGSANVATSTTSDSCDNSNIVRDSEASKITSISKEQRR